MKFKHMRKAMVLGLIVTNLVSGSIFANTSGTVTNTHVNVRSQASTESKVLGQKNTGDRISIIAKEGDWFKIQYSDSTVAYIFGQYIKEDAAPKVAANLNTAEVKVTPAATTQAAVATTASVDIKEAAVPAAVPVTLIVTTDILNMRSSADLTSKDNIIDKLKGGELLTLVADAGEWYQITTADGKSGYVFKDYVTPYTPSTPSANGTELRDKLVAFAKQYLGLPYRSGGSSLTSGSDCSGFTKAIFQQFGIDLNRSSGAQASNGVAVSYNDLQPGDLICYGYSSISHVAIYIGNGQIIHETVPGKGVEIDPAYSVGGKKVLACRRVIND